MLIYYSNQIKKKKRKNLIIFNYQFNELKCESVLHAAGRRNNIEIIVFFLEYKNFFLSIKAFNKCAKLRETKIPLKYHQIKKDFYFM